MRPVRSLVTKLYIKLFSHFSGTQRRNPSQSDRQMQQHELIRASSYDSETMENSSQCLLSVHFGSRVCVCVPSQLARNGLK